MAFVRFWRAFVSPSYGNVCKYYPSCSAYGLRALETRGAVVGTALTAWRILRCNPWSHGGYDPVPGTPEHAARQAEKAASASPATPTLPDVVMSGTSHYEGEI